MADFRIKKGFFLAPVPGKLTRKVFVVQKRLIWGIWLNVFKGNSKNQYYFHSSKQAKKFIRHLRK